VPRAVKMLLVVRRASSFHDFDADERLVEAECVVLRLGVVDSALGVAPRVEVNGPPIGPQIIRQKHAQPRVAGFRV
jgi:hypothetical protein